MRLAVAIAVGLVQAYRYAVSPLLPPACRYEPSCSAYALQALRLHGAARGGWLAARRIARCHPWCAGGWDPVPGSAEAAAKAVAQAEAAARSAPVVLAAATSTELPASRGAPDSVRPAVAGPRFPS